MVGIVDPSFHLSLKELRKKIEEAEPFYKDLDSIDILLFERREIHLNKLSKIHTNSHNPILG